MELRLALAAVMAIGMVSACATPQPELGLDGHRTVFHNPYAPIELENGPVGPEQCARCPGGVWIDGLFYPGSGRYAYDRNGNRVRLTRSERRQARERFRLIGAQIEQNRAVEEFNAQRQMEASQPPIPSAPPTASHRPESIKGAQSNDVGASGAVRSGILR